MGGVELIALPLEMLRTEVALVTQEHHVFVGSVRDNIILAREDSPRRRGRRGAADGRSVDWVSRLPQRLNTMLGSGNLP